MPAPLGNQNNKKWKTQEERQKAFKAVCEHIAAGYLKGSFPLSDWDTVERYCQEFPFDFPAEKLNDAMRAGYLVWDKIAMDGTTGKIDGFNATSFIFNMKNRFAADWKDKRETELSGGLEVFDKRAIDAAAQALSDTTGKD